MPKDKAYQQAEQKIQQALQSGGFPKRPDRFPRDARKPESRSPHATWLNKALMKPVRSVPTHPKGG